MSLRQSIKNEIREGHLNPVFSVKNLLQNRVRNSDSYKIGGSLYKKASIVTNLNNRSVGPENRKGNHVKNGKEPWFEKHEGGQFSIINAAREDIQGRIDAKRKNINKPAETDDKNVDSVKIRDSAKKIAKDFVVYFRDKPFRLLSYERKGLWYPSSGPITGWKNRLNHYLYNGAGWKSTSAMLSGIQRNLSAQEKIFLYSSMAYSLSKTLAIYRRVLTFGIPGVRVKKPILSKDLAHLHDLWAGRIITKVNSSLTKLFAFSKPDEFVIFDSRVAAAIVSAAEDIYRIRYTGKKPICLARNNFRICFPDIGPFKIGSRGGTRPRGVRALAGWPCSYGKVRAQLQANELCKAIRDELNRIREDGKSDWTLREVEAVLFMEGY